MKTLTEKYATLMSICEKFHKIEYSEYLKEYPTIPFNRYQRYQRKLPVWKYDIICKILDEAIQFGGMDDMFEALYFTPKIGGDFYEE